MIIYFRYTYHGLTGASLDVILSQMANFLQMHQKEVLFLDFNHLHIITSKGLQELRRILNSTFGSKIYRGQDSELSLTDIWRNRSNIIIFFRGVRKINTPSVYNAHVFDESHLLSPFDTSKFYEFSTWRDYLKEIYKNRPRSHTFYVTQGIMQPNLLSIAASSLIKNGSLESLISDGATKALVKWLRTCKSGTSGVNIVIADFIQKYNFVETVLNLNMSNS